MLTESAFTDKFTLRLDYDPSGSVQHSTLSTIATTLNYFSVHNNIIPFKKPQVFKLNLYIYRYQIQCRIT